MLSHTYTHLWLDLLFSSHSVRPVPDGKLLGIAGAERFTGGMTFCQLVGTEQLTDWFCPVVGTTKEDPRRDSMMVVQQNCNMLGITTAEAQRLARQTDVQDFYKGAVVACIGITKATMVIMTFLSPNQQCQSTEVIEQPLTLHNKKRDIRSHKSTWGKHAGRGSSP